MKAFTPKAAPTIPLVPKRKLCRIPRGADHLPTMKAVKAERKHIRAKKGLAPPASFGLLSGNKTDSDYKVVRAFHEMRSDKRFKAIPFTLVFRPTYKCQGRHLPIDLTEARKTGLIFFDHIQRDLRKRQISAPALYVTWIWEYGPTTGLHVHGTIQVPRGASSRLLEAIVRYHWMMLENGRDVHIGYDASKLWDEYCLKPKGFVPTLDCLDLELTHLPA